MDHSLSQVEQPVASWRMTIRRAGAIVGKPWRRYRASLFQGYLIGAILVFSILAILAHTIAYFTFDVTITREIQEIQILGFGGLMGALSWLGFTPQVNVIAVLVFVFLYISGLKWESVVLFLGTVTISAIGLGIKLAVDRPRPSPDLVNVIAQLSDYSFPSGHVLYYTTFYGFLLFLSFTLLKPSWGRTLLVTLFSGLVGLVGFSRIYEGQHWASDVLAAYLLGSAWLALVVYVYRWGKPRFFIHQPIAKEAPVTKQERQSP
jgi:membrane-associated phospholipid phosphatase